MKKWYLVGLVILFVSICSVATAAPVGNPTKPILEGREIPLNVGAELDFVGDRDLDVSGEDVCVEDLGWYGAKISYILEDKVEPYVLLGVAQAEFSESYSGTDLVYETETDLALGLGVTVFLHEFDNGVRLGADGKFRRVEPDLDKVMLGGIEYSPGVPGFSDFAAEYSEWQIALGISKEIGDFVPYGGIKYTDVETSLKATISGTTYQIDDANSDNVFGIFIGCDFLIPTEDLSISVEARFIDELAFSVAGNYRF